MNLHNLSTAKFDTYHGCLAMPRSGDTCILLRMAIQEMSSTFNKLTAFGDTCVGQYQNFILVRFC